MQSLIRLRNRNNKLKFIHNSYYKLELIIIWTTRFSPLGILKFNTLNRAKSVPFTWPRLIIISHFRMVNAPTLRLGRRRTSNWPGVFASLRRSTNRVGFDGEFSIAAHQSDTGKWIANWFKYVHRWFIAM